MVMTRLELGRIEEEVLGAQSDAEAIYQDWKKQHDKENSAGKAEAIYQDWKKNKDRVAKGGAVAASAGASQCGASGSMMSFILTVLFLMTVYFLFRVVFLWWKRSGKDHVKAGIEKWRTSDRRFKLARAFGGNR